MIFLVGLSFLTTFAVVVLFGAPYLPTRKVEARKALKLLDLKSGQTLIDLGSGDGVMLLLAAQQGIKGIGYELNPILVLISRLRLWRYRKLVTIYSSNYWQEKLPKADGIYVFLIARQMKRLEHKLEEEIKSPTKVLSYTFKLPGSEPSKIDGAALLYTFPKPD